MKKIAIFDLDGTILGGMSSENAFILYLLRKGVLGFKQFGCFINQLFKLWSEHKKHAFVVDKSYLCGLEKEKISTLGKAFVARELFKHLRPFVKTRIEAHRENGDHIILMTGSPQCLAEEFAKELEIDEVYATKIPTENGRFINAPPTQHPYKENKLILAKAICEKYGATMEDCVAYGNSINDQYILDGAGKAIAVTPNKGLRKIAEAKGWDILEK